MRHFQIGHLSKTNEEKQKLLLGGGKFHVKSCNNMADFYGAERKKPSKKSKQNDFQAQKSGKHFLVKKRKRSSLVRTERL